MSLQRCGASLEAGDQLELEEMSPAATAAADLVVVEADRYPSNDHNLIALTGGAGINNLDAGSPSDPPPPGQGPPPST